MNGQARWQLLAAVTRVRLRFYRLTTGASVYTRVSLDAFQPRALSISVISKRFTGPSSLVPARFDLFRLLPVTLSRRLAAASRETSLSVVSLLIQKHFVSRA